MKKSDLSDPNSPIPSAADLREQLLEEKLAEVAAKDAARQQEQDEKAKFALDFLSNHVTEKEREVIRRLIQAAVKNGQFEAMVYSFDSGLCTDKGRAITNSDKDWPSTLQGKARELYDRYMEYAHPKGYKLKAMIINYPGGKPGDVGFFLDWSPSRV